MATIDLIVLGILKKESLSAYDIQKLVEYRNISKWVKISTPSIYKKVIQLEEKVISVAIVSKLEKCQRKQSTHLLKMEKRNLKLLCMRLHHILFTFF